MRSTAGVDGCRGGTVVITSSILVMSSCAPAKHTNRQHQHAGVADIHRSLLHDREHQYFFGTVMSADPFTTAISEP